MGLLTVPIQYYPYIMIGLDFIMGGPQAAGQAVAGAVVGHAWWWSVWGAGLGGQGPLATYSTAPQWLRNLFGERGPANRPPAAGGTAAGLAQAGVHVTAPRRPAENAGTTTGYRWGSGQRLGSWKNYNLILCKVFLKSFFTWLPTLRIELFRRTDILVILGDQILGLRSLSGAYSHQTPKVYIPCSSNEGM